MSDKDEAAEDIREVLGALPPRWGRMPLLCRALVLETGRLLRKISLWDGEQTLEERGMHVGFIGATRYGSMCTDLEFAEGLALGEEMASPALFGYTLANMPLAEAAVHFGLTGPVFALFDGCDPLATARREAEIWLEWDASLSLMLASAFDHEKSATGELLRVSVIPITRTSDSP